MGQLFRGVSRGVLARAWPGHPRRWADVPEAIRPTLTTTARLTIAAVIAFGVTVALSNGEVDLTGALTALLVLQASAWSTLKMGLLRVIAVLGGVLIATALSTWIGLTWWSLGAAIAAALLLGKVFRLGDQALETPISAMLILAVGNHDIAAETRVLNTLIGAGVGMAFGLLFPTAMQIPAARRALTKVAEATAAPLSRAAAAMADSAPDRDQAEEWLAESRVAVAEVSAASQRFALLRDSRRFNPRALGTANVEPILSSALTTFERCLLAVRALFVSVLAELPGGSDAATADPYGDELRQAFGVVLQNAADSLLAFGHLVLAEVDGREAETEAALAANLDILRETRAILTELILVDARDNSSAWLLRGSIVAALDQVLVQLDLEERARDRQAWRELEQHRLARQLPSLIQGVLPHPERPYPRALDAVIAQLREGQRPGTPYSSYLEPPPDRGDRGADEQR